MRTIMPVPDQRTESGTAKGSKSIICGREHAARIARVTSATAELMLASAGPEQELATRLADLTGVDAELWEQRTGESRERYLDRAASAILDTNPEALDQAAELTGELELATEKAEAALVAQAEAIVTSEVARYRLLAEVARIEREGLDQIEQATRTRQRRAAGVEKDLDQAARIAAEYAELDRTDGEPDDPTWSAAELRGVQRHSPFRNGSVYRFRRTDGTLAPEVG